MERRIADRLSGTALALLLQGGFLFLLLQSVQVLTHSAPQRELTLILPRLAAAPVPQAPARSGGVAAPRPTGETPMTAPPIAASPDAGALRGLGQSLFGCAPEAYASLTSDERAHCPKPGVNAPLTTEEELNPKSHSRDAATWQEDLDERHFDYSACVGAERVMACMYRMMAQEKARRKQTRTFIESDNARRDADEKTKPPLPDIPVRRGR